MIEEKSDQHHFTKKETREKETRRNDMNAYKRKT